MRKEKKQDLPDPEQQAIEEHVKQLMDPSVPDAPEPIIEELPTEIKLADESPIENKPAPVPTKPSKQKIAVTHFDDEPVAELPTKPATKVSVTEPDETPTEELTDVSDETETVVDEADELPTAPVLVKKSRKIVPVLHEEEPVIAKPETVDEQVEASEETNTEQLAEDVSEEPDLEPEAEESPEVETAPIPTVEEPKPAASKRFTPLTNVRPQIDEPEPAILVDPKTEAAVDDILAAESDQVLEAEDRERELIEAFKRPKPSFGKRLFGFLFAWWRNRLTRYSVLTLLIVGIGGSAAVPATRYLALNTAGVRSSASLVVLDESTQQPLKNVKVSIGEASGITGADGRVTLSNLKLGSSQIIIEKRAFAALNRQHVLGWGSNPLGEFKLTPTGSQYVFTVLDYLSDKPLENIEATSGEASAVSNNKGEIKLTTDQKNIESLDIIIKGEGFREEKLTIDLDDKQAKTVKLVSGRKHVFVSKRSGKFDVFKVDIDGKSEERILAGTGTEKDDMIVVSHPTDEITAIVSTRENKRNKDGFLLSTLTVIDLKSNATKALVTSERVQVIGWVSGRLVFVAVAEGTSSANPKRHRLMSHDPKTETTKEIASSNFFNDVIALANRIYYAPSSALQTSGETGLIRIDSDGSNKEIIVNREVWNLFRTSYDHLAIATPQQWYDFRVGDTTPVKLEGAPANPMSRSYVDSPDGKRSLWVDNRDGKGVLLFYDPVSKLDSTIRTQSGLKGPVRWLNNTTLVFRVSTEDETADFALNIDGGEAKKIRDVTDTGGVDKWYFY